MTNKFLFLFLFIILVLSTQQPFAAEESTKDISSEGLSQSYHRLQTQYAIGRIQPVRQSGRATLHNLMVSGDFVLAPKMSFTARIPFVTLAGELAISNPAFGLKADIFEDVLKGYPTFVSLRTEVKPPLSSTREFVFKRTDIFVGLESLREVQHLSLKSKLGYTLKLDPSSASEKYGNELAASVGVELNTGYKLALGLDFNYHRAGSFSMASGDLPGRSVFMLQPNFAYHYAPDMMFQGTFAMPVGRQKLDEAVLVFGDYTIAGLGGNTFFLTFEKKF